MSAKSHELGLCITCIHLHTCTSKRNISEPILFCEQFEYDQHIVPESSADDSSLARIAPEEIVTETRPDEQFKGLCVNCSNRNHCKIPKPPGGVWHCAQYE
ncbi:hypothetical protein JXJ21_00510 [candidate division KSB1 bacterium]|nr:hypothetical protein [candidate division KSB1 bacterium]